MPTIGWFEILIVVAISVIVIGPKDFPFMLKKIGTWIGSLKRYLKNIQQEISIIEKEDIEIQTNEENIEKKKDINDQ